MNEKGPGFSDDASNLESKENNNLDLQYEGEEEFKKERPFWEIYQNSVDAHYVAWYEKNKDKIASQLEENSQKIEEQIKKENLEKVNNIVWGEINSAVYKTWHKGSNPTVIGSRDHSISVEEAVALLKDYSSIECMENQDNSFFIKRGVICKGPNPEDENEKEMGSKINMTDESWGRVVDKFVNNLKEVGYFQ
jgi:hypothetical protein